MRMIRNLQLLQEHSRGEEEGGVTAAVVDPDGVRPPQPTDGECCSAQRPTSAHGRRLQKRQPSERNE